MEPWWEHRPSSCRRRIEKTPAMGRGETLKLKSQPLPSGRGMRHPPERECHLQPNYTWLVLEEPLHPPALGLPQISPIAVPNNPMQMLSFLSRDSEHLPTETLPHCRLALPQYMHTHALSNASAFPPTSVHTVPVRCPNPFYSECLSPWSLANVLC